MATPRKPTPIFGEHAVSLRHAGLAVLPADGKRPIRSGFNKWKHAPGIAVVEKWARQNPDANIAYIPGLSRTPSNPHGIVVVDADTAAECERSVDAFGPTPAVVLTRRGRHLIYKAPEEPLGTIGSLRSFDIEIDIKHGQKGSGICVAPPSSHPDQNDFNYSWQDGSGPEALADLPTFDIEALHRLIGRESTMLPNTTYTAPPPPRGPDCSRRGNPRPAGRAPPRGPDCSRRGNPRPAGRALLRNGSRKLGLNDHLAAHAWAIDDLDTCLDIARTWNDDLYDTLGIERLADGEILIVCKSVMADVECGKIVRTLQRRAIATTEADEIARLLGSNRNGDAALALLLKLRTAHGERCRGGGSFAFCASAMVEKRTMGPWAARKYRIARDTLLRAGLIQLVTPATRHLAGQYRLVDRALAPSVANTKAR